MLPFDPRNLTMTCILWNNHRLYADSRVTVGDEVMHSFSKIRGCDPLVFRYKKQDIEDTIMGWVCSGAVRCAEGFMAQLAKFKGNLDALSTAFEVSLDAGIYNFDNLYEIIMVGTKACYSYRFELPAIVFQVYDHRITWAMGTGAKTVVHNVAEEKMNPVRAMFDTFYKDPLSGGMIDMWEVKKSTDSTTFKRIGIYNQRTKDELRSLIQHPTKLVIPDYMSADQSVETFMIYAGIQDDEDVTDLIRFLERRKYTRRREARLREKKSNIIPQLQSLFKESNEKAPPERSRQLKGKLSP